MSPGSSAAVVPSTSTATATSTAAGTSNALRRVSGLCALSVALAALGGCARRQPTEERPRAPETIGAELAADALDAGPEAAPGAPEALPSWVPPEAPLTIVEAPDREQNLGIAPAPPTPEGAEAADAGACRLVTVLRCP